MNKRTIKLTAIVALLLLFLAACGSDDDTVDAGGSTDDTVDTGGSTDDTTADPADDGTDGDSLPPLGGGPYPIATLEVTYTHPDAETLTYTISCLGDTATITPAVAGISEQAACLRLAEPEAQSLLIDGPAPDRVCTEIYGGPDKAVITGTIDDQPVDTVISREDGCRIDDWDNVLGGMLPTPIGA